MDIDDLGPNVETFEFTFTIPAGAGGVVIGRTGDADATRTIPGITTASRILWWEYSMLGSNTVNAKVKMGADAFAAEASPVAANYIVRRPGTGQWDPWFHRAAGAKGQCMRVGPEEAGTVVITGRVLAIRNPG